MVLVHPFTVLTSLSWFTVTALQSSLAVGGVNVGVAVQLIVALAPAVLIVGGRLSIMVIVCDTVELWLPQPSTASQRRGMVPVHPFTELTSVSWFTVTALQSSLAVGGVNVGVAVQLIVALAPAALIVGGRLSITGIVGGTGGR